jgi:glycosyltransferase involved in cell wall biosynthesis
MGSSETNPLVSFVIIAYNQEEYIREAVEGAFSQTYSPLEIILSDDCSLDSTFDIMQEMAASYKGKHRVILNRNKSNLRLAAHVNIVMAMAGGEIIVLAGGDDISMPDRCALSAEFLMENPDHCCVSFDTVKFTHSKDIPSVPLAEKVHVASYSLDDLIRDSSIHTNGASRAIRRRVIDSFPPLQSDSPTEDSTILLRCLLLGKAAQVSIPIVYYRVHGGNLYASANKFSINYDAIYRQYICDMKYAFESGLMGDTSPKKLEDALNKKLERNLIRSKFFKEKNKFKVFIMQVFPSRSIRLKQKYRYLIRVLRSSVNVKS